MFSYRRKVLLRKGNSTVSEELCPCRKSCCWLFVSWQTEPSLRFVCRFCLRCFLRPSLNDWASALGILTRNAVHRIRILLVFICNDCWSFTKKSELFGSLTLKNLKKILYVCADVQKKNHDSGLRSGLSCGLRPFGDSPWASSHVPKWSADIWKQLNASWGSLRKLRDSQHFPSGYRLCERPCGWLYPGVHAGCIPVGGAAAVVFNSTGTVSLSWDI